MVARVVGADSGASASHEESDGDDGEGQRS
jgi:hypothetical protein